MLYFSYKNRMSEYRQKNCFHAITVDVEDWYHLCGIDIPEKARCNPRVEYAAGQVLALLRQLSVKATFFILGEVADAFPMLAPAIASDGHEVASHGWSHRMVTELSVSEFRNELDRTADLLEHQTGNRPVGFRAPRWSLCHKKTPWAFEVLAERGYLYDSSLSPLPVVGNPRGLRYPHLISTAAGNIHEFPPMVTPAIPFNMPSGGGWGFRAFPACMITGTIQRYTKEGIPAVIFIHPRELDPESPRIHLPWLSSFIIYGTKNSAAGRLADIAGRFSFKPLKELLEPCQSAS